MCINDVRLLIHATSEQPAWDIPLRAGQEYIGQDQNPDGTRTLIIDLGDWSHPTTDQVDYLERNSLPYHLSPDWAAPHALRRYPVGEVAA